MTKTLINAAAAFAACFVAANAARAEDNHTSDNSAMLESIYAEMDQNRSNTFEIVMASAEQRMAARLAKIENLDVSKPAEPFVLASN